MKLKKVRIENYRSIVDTGTVEIEDGVTVVVGKNEQGKSTFLAGIRAFNQDVQFRAADLPHHLRPALEERPAAEIAIVTVHFALDGADRKKLAPIIRDIENVAELKSIKYYGNNYAFSVVKTDGAEEPLQYSAPDISGSLAQIKTIADNLRTALQGHATRVPAFAVNNDTVDQLVSGLKEAKVATATEVDDVIRTFTTSIKVLTNHDQAILDDINAAITAFEKPRAEARAANASDRSAILRQALPLFILHSTASDHIPNHVAIADFVKDPDATSKGMANLCRAAGLSIPKIRDLAATDDTQQREAYEDHHKGAISGGLNEFWTQTKYTVHFRIEKERLSVSISDGTYSPRIAPSDRSEGFQWYLSFYATMLNDIDVANKTFLLLDNPGLELHLDGQRDIKRFLEEKISLDSQVIYVTHSPAMVEPFNQKQIRRVELLPGQKGTVVRSFDATGSGPFDLLEPVRAAMGMSLISSLVMNDWNVLVEGAADKPIVEGIFFSHWKEHREKVLVNGSVSESKNAFLPLFYKRASLPYVVLLDADSGGRELFNDLTRLGVPAENIVCLDEVFTDKKTDFALEDILSEQFYYEAVQAAYPSKTITRPAESAPIKMRAKVYEESFKVTQDFAFSKRRVAETIKKLLQEKREDPETNASLGTLSTAIIKKLQAQVPAAAKALSSAAITATPEPIEQKPVRESDPSRLDACVFYSPQGTNSSKASRDQATPCCPAS